MVASRIKEDVLRDTRYPVHRIADQLLPYLEILVEQFEPERVILFGSYANGNPTPDSDIDLLVIKTIDKSAVADATSIRRAVRSLRHSVANLPLDIMVRDPEDFNQRIRDGASFHTSIARSGIGIV